MNESRVTWLEAQVVEEQVEFTLVELCRATGASEEQLALWVAEGVVEVRTTDARATRFGGDALHRVLTAQRLTRDLQINAAGVALALDLLDEIKTLRSQLLSRSTFGSGRRRFKFNPGA